jgi:hypothetical protein
VLIAVVVVVDSYLSQDCIDNCDQRANAISLVESLPDLNKELLIYLVRFLKVGHSGIFSHL